MATKKRPLQNDVDYMERRAEGQMARESGVSPKTLVEEARNRFKVASEADEKQRKREQDALRFQVPGQQWTDEEKAERKGRPTVAVSKLDQPRRLLLNQMRQADLGVNISPITEEANDETSEMLQGLYRDMERYGRAELVRYWAFDRAVTCGRGAYRMILEYDPYAPEEFARQDQRICLKRIYHQDGVYFDPAAEEPDFRDGRFVFVVRWMSKDEFKREFPKAKEPGSSKLAMESLEREAPEWVRDEDYLVAEYWTRDEQEDGSAKVAVTKMCGWEVLEKTQPWPGRFIPIIPTFAIEVQPYDEERRYMGLIEPAMDAQRLYNYAACTLIEDLQVESKAPYITPVEAIEGYEEYWKNANRKNYPYLPYNGRAKNGEATPPPQRAQVDTSRMSLALQTLQMADQFIQASTNIYDPSLGRFTQQERSGRALLATQQQAEASTGGYLQNLADVSMTYEADIWLDLVPHVYSRPGRIARIIHGDDKKSKPVMLGKPYVMDQQSQQPRPAMPQEQGTKTYDLRKGTYSVAVTVGKSYQTRLQEGAEFTSELLTKVPQLLPMIGDIVMEFRNEPGSKEIAKRLRKMLPPGMADSDDGQKTPEQLEAENRQLQQMGQQLQQQLQQATQALETEQAKQQATIEKAQVDSQTSLQKTEMDNATKVQIAQMQGQIDMLIAQMKAQAEQQKLTMQAQNAEREAQREDVRAERDAFREDTAADRQADEAERGRRHEVGMAVVGSALEPEKRPGDGGAA